MGLFTAGEVILLNYPSPISVEVSYGQDSCWHLPHAVIGSFAKSPAILMPTRPLYP